MNKIPIDLFLNDYITFYLVKYNSDDNDFNNMINYYNLSYNDINHRLINLLLNLRFNENIEIIKNNKDETLKILLIKINWIY